jgi:hypothetical protein
LDGVAVDVGVVDARPADTARLMLREFALIYGNYLLVVPMPLTVAVARIPSLVITDTFGLAQTIPHCAATAEGGRWRMFAISGDALDHRFVLQPVFGSKPLGDQRSS